MSSKFISSGGDIISLLSSGKLTLNIQSVTDQSLVPSLPICTNSLKKLITRQIQVADIGFTVVENPSNADINVNGFNVINVSSLNFSSNGIIDGINSITIGGTIATSVNIGHASISTIITGPLRALTPIGSWYSTTNFNPAFTAEVAKLIPPTASTAGSLLNFTESKGVLTCTCPITRDYRIDYDISFLMGALNSNMTFFNSKNGNLVIGTQTRIFQEAAGGMQNNRMTLHFSDNITLSSGDTVQLASICALSTSAPTFNFVSCKINATLS